MKKIFSKILIVGIAIALIFWSTPAHGAQVTMTITSGSTFSTSTDGSSIIVEAYGAGGGGSRIANEGSGGGGGEYCKSTVSYTSGSSIPISIGIGGVNNGNGVNASDGGATTWNTNVVVANGGKGGSYFAQPNGSNALGGTLGTGTLCYNGGSTGVSIQAGGGAAGPNSAGGSPPNWYTGGSAGGGYAGTGGTPAGGGAAGNAFGGGAAGASSGWNGSSGSQGLLVVTFNQAAPTSNRKIRGIGISR